MARDWQCDHYSSDCVTVVELAGIIIVLVTQTYSVFVDAKPVLYRFQISQPPLTATVQHSFASMTQTCKKQNS